MTGIGNDAGAGDGDGNTAMVIGNDNAATAAGGDHNTATVTGNDNFAFAGFGDENTAVVIGIDSTQPRGMTPLTQLSRATTTTTPWRWVRAAPPPRAPATTTRPS